MIPDVNEKPQSLLDKYLLDHIWNFWLLEFFGYQVLTHLAIQKSSKAKTKNIPLDKCLSYVAP